MFKLPTSFGAIKTACTALCDCLLPFTGVAESVLQRLSRNAARPPALLFSCSLFMRPWLPCLRNLTIFKKPPETVRSHLQCAPALPNARAQAKHLRTHIRLTECSQYRMTSRTCFCVASTPAFLGGLSSPPFSRPAPSGPHSRASAPTPPRSHRRRARGSVLRIVTAVPCVHAQPP